jgi:hypothetical protein
VGQHRRQPLGNQLLVRLSKRTRVYVGYVKINNDANASYNFNINPYPGSATPSPVDRWAWRHGFVMGMYHNF